MNDALLTQAEASALLSIPARTLEAWRGRGRGPEFIRVSARCVRYRRDAIERWLSARAAGGEERSDDARAEPR
jgi:helix-turn-helix protein